MSLPDRVLAFFRGTGPVRPVDEPAPQGRQAWVERMAAFCEYDRMSADDVMELKYEEVALICGVRLGPRRESPADFFYRDVRSQAASALRFKVRDVQVTTLKDNLMPIIESARGAGLERDQIEQALREGVQP